MIETSVAAVTLRLVAPVTEPCFAEIVVDCPEVTPVARPVELMVAAPVFEDVQATEVVRSCMLVSENVPVALNCMVLPASTELLAGVTAIETSVAAVTVRTVEPETLPCDADMEAFPAFNAVAMPAEVIVAMALLEDAQVTALVIS